MSSSPAPSPDVDSDADSEQLSEAERQELLDQLERRRNPRGIAAAAVVTIGITFSLFQLWLAARGFEFGVSVPLIGEIDLGSLQLLQVNAVHVVFALILAFLIYPPTTGDGALARRFARVVPMIEDRLGFDNPVTRGVRGLRSGVRWLAVDAGRERVTPVDVLCILVAAATAIYMLISFEEVQQTRVFGLNSVRTIGEVFPFLEPLTGALSAIGIPLDELSLAYLLGIAGVLLVLEATRRALGVALTSIAVSFILYAKYGNYLPRDGVVGTPFGFGIDVPYIDILWIRSGNWPTIVQNFWYNTENGVFGIPVTVSVQFIYIFVLFGAFLEMSGAGQWFIDLAYSLTGHRKGGPAKASVLSSGFMGTISGSSIANTVTTGAFTIPLMRRSGYRDSFAGAVEASASSGGQILPPVMGAAAFLIVEYTATPYSDVIIAAAVPAAVFFFGVWVMVHLEASRTDIRQIANEDTIDLRSHLRTGWFYLVPVAVLLYYLVVARLTVARSAWYSIVAIVAVIAVVAAYSERTRVPLLGGVAGLFALEVGSYLVAGTDLLGLIFGGGAGGAEGVGSGAAAGGASIAGALAGAAGELGTIAIVVSAAVLLARPAAEGSYLDYDGAVDDNAEIGAERLDRPGLADNGAYRYGSFLLTSMEAGARTATPVVVAVAVVGIIPGVLSATGLGPNLTVFIQSLAGGSVVLLLLITAIAAIILGMGVPTTATYILLAAVLAPAIVDSGAVPELAAHMFILYFGVIADITPPVAVAAYAASGISKSDPFKTGVEAFSLSLNKAIVPFAFALTPGILLLRPAGNGESRVIGLADVLDIGFFVPEVLIPIVGTFVGVLALGPTIIGYLYTDVSRGERALFALSAVLLMAPITFFTAIGDLMGAVSPYTLAALPLTGFVLRAIGAALFVALAVKNRRGAEQRPGTDATTESSEPTTD